MTPPLKHRDKNCEDCSACLAGVGTPVVKQTTEDGNTAGKTGNLIRNHFVTMCFCLLP